MKKSVTLVFTMLLLFTLSGCISAPFVPPQGYAYSQVKAPLDVDFNNTQFEAMKQGNAHVTCILGLFTFGDASAKTAAKNGQITTVNHADYEHFNLLGIYQKTTVIVYGE